MAANVDLAATKPVVAGIIGHPAMLAAGGGLGTTLRPGDRRRLRFQPLSNDASVGVDEHAIAAAILAGRDVIVVLQWLRVDHLATRVF